MENGKTDFKCQNCGRVMFTRRGNTIIAYGFEVELPRSHNIMCQECQEPTRFCVDRSTETVLKVRVDN